VGRRGAYLLIGHLGVLIRLGLRTLGLDMRALDGVARRAACRGEAAALASQLRLLHVLALVLVLVHLLALALVLVHLRGAGGALFGPLLRTLLGALLGSILVLGALLGASIGAGVARDLVGDRGVGGALDGHEADLVAGEELLRERALPAVKDCTLNVVVAAAATVSLDRVVDSLGRAADDVDDVPVTRLRVSAPEPARACGDQGWGQVWCGGGGQKSRHAHVSSTQRAEGAT